MILYWVCFIAGWIGKTVAMIGKENNSNTVEIIGNSVAVMFFFMCICFVIADATA